jgi:hypothetical protein
MNEFEQPFARPEVVDVEGHRVRWAADGEATEDVDVEGHVDVQEPKDRI